MTKARKIFSLKQVERETGISASSILHLLKHYRDSIPHKRVGDHLRFPAEAIPTIVRLWREYTRGIQMGKDDHTWRAELVDLYIQSALKFMELTDLFHSLRRTLYTAPTLTYFINALPGTELRLILPIAVTADIESSTKTPCARFIEVGLEAYGDTPTFAVLNLREELMRTFLRLEGQEERSPREMEQFELLSRIIRRD